MGRTLPLGVELLIERARGALVVGNGGGHEGRHDGGSKDGRACTLNSRQYEA